MSQLDEFDEKSEQNQQLWDARIARERLALSVSVEEALAHDFLPEVDDAEEERDGLQLDVQPVPDSSKHTAIIRPRLTLQSKPMPVVQPHVPVQSRESSSLQAVHSEHSEPRLAGRSTKVRLKAIPKTEEKREPQQPKQPQRARQSQHKVPSNREVMVEKQGQNPAKEFLHQNGHHTLSGSGKFEPGQGEIAVPNHFATRSSVVAVMLAGDPGPVVVQYISLQPQIGFTVHLSAPAEKRTPFNYVILTPERN